MEYTHFVHTCLISNIRAGILGGIFFTQVHAAVVINEVERDQPCTDAVETIEGTDTGIRDSLINTAILDLTNSNASSSYDFFDLTRLKIDTGAYVVLCDNSITGVTCNLEVNSDTGWLQKVTGLYDDPAAVYPDGLMFGLMANETIGSNLLTLVNSITYAGADSIFSPSAPDQSTNSGNTNDRISFRLHSNLLCLFGIQTCDPDGL